MDCALATTVYVNVVLFTLFIFLLQLIHFGQKHQLNTINYEHESSIWTVSEMEGHIHTVKYDKVRYAFLYYV